MKHKRSLKGGATYVRPALRQPLPLDVRKAMINRAMNRHLESDSKAWNLLGKKLSGNRRGMVAKTIIEEGVSRLGPKAVSYLRHVSRERKLKTSSKAKKKRLSKKKKKVTKRRRSKSKSKSKSKRLRRSKH